MALSILLTLALSPLAAWLGGQRARYAAWLALWPAALGVWFSRQLWRTHHGEIAHEEWRWVPEFGLTLSFRLDGLSGLMALLICGVGACILAYAAHYFEAHPQRGRVHALLFVFMAAMLGVVLTDNLFALFVFWELTGFSSYLLVGFDHENPAARRAALQALLVTGAGGLCLLAAGALLSQVTGTPTISALAGASGALHAHPYYLAIVLLIALAAFTKSAQFPFHFWLPGAMAAPTPVSAYLHSATMVKAGVYLLARLTPALGGSELWQWLLCGTGLITMLLSSAQALQKTDLKQILAYTTVGSLGLIVLLLGLGTPDALAAAVLYIVAHALYKGALFLVTGVVDHSTHTRDITKLGGLKGALPAPAFAGALAAASMVGLPLFAGFLAKEQVYLAALEQPRFPLVAAGGLVLGSALLGAGGLLVGIRPFWGRAGTAAAEPARAGLWLPPLVLALACVAAGAPQLVEPLAAPATSAISREPYTLHLALWHGWSLPLLLSGVTLVLTAALLVASGALRRRPAEERWALHRVFDGALAAIDRLSRRLGPAMQEGSLATYLLVFVVTAGALIASGLFFATGKPEVRLLLEIRVHEVLVLLMIFAGAISAAFARRTMVAVLSLGTSGYGVALTFLLYGAPDLAMTQFAVETLTAVIFVFVFWRFPHVATSSTRTTKLRDGVLSIGFGLLITLLALETSTSSTNKRLSHFFAEAAPTLAYGHNIVNVILVDFRAIDTMGEICVLVMAAVGVRALLRFAAEERKSG